MAGWRTHDEIIAWQLSYELKKRVYALIRSGPIRRDYELHDQLRRSAGSAPRLIAEGLGRYLPGDFSRYLRDANGELKETFESLRDCVDRGYATQTEVEPMQRLSKRASKAATSLIAYLLTAHAPNEEPRRHRRTQRRPTEPRRIEAREPREPEEPSEPKEPKEPTERQPPEPSEPSEPSEPPEPPEPLEPMD